MSLTEPDRQALGGIADGLAGSDPRLASMLAIFSRLAAGEQMPAAEKIRARPRPYPRPGRPPAMLVLWAVISAALLAAALALNTSGQACTQLAGTACPASPLPHHGEASRVLNPRPPAQGPSRTYSRPAAHPFIQTGKRT